MRIVIAGVVAFGLVAGPGCASNDGSWIGAGVGAAAGALVGGIIGHQTGHKWEGALIGATAGALAGYIVGTQLGDQGGEDHAETDAHRRAAEAFDRANRTEDLASAMALFDQAIALDPIHPEPYNNKGLVLLNLGDREGAQESFRQALNADPNYREARENLDRMAAEGA